MNHCPVYTKIGGHAYGTTYPGPIGQVVMPQLKGMQAHGDLLDACSLNGACGEACPVQIELPNLIRTLRTKRRAQSSFYSCETFVWKVWTKINTHPTLYRLALKIMSATPLSRKFYPKAWTNSRSPAKPAEKSLRERLENSPYSEKGK
jgi:L-lactate dehydrogenase complex protein LldF